MKSSTSAGGTTSYSYDSNGNLVAGSTGWTYTWDWAGDLLKVSENSVSEGSYAYDAQGRRVESLESSTIFYAYMGTNTLYEDKAANRASND